MQLVSLVEVRDLAGGARHLYLRFRAPTGKHLDLPVTVEQAGEVLAHLSGTPSVGAPPPEDQGVGGFTPGEVVGAPTSSPFALSAIIGDTHMRLPTFRPPQHEAPDDDYGGLG